MYKNFRQIATDIQELFSISSFDSQGRAPIPPGYPCLGDASMVEIHEALNQANAI